MQNIFKYKYITKAFVDSPIYSERAEYDVIVSFTLHKFDKIYVGIKSVLRDETLLNKCIQYKHANGECVKPNLFNIPNSLIYSHREMYLPLRIEGKNILKLVMSDNEDYYYLLNYDNIEEDKKISMYLFHKSGTSEQIGENKLEICLKHSELNFIP